LELPGAKPEARVGHNAAAAGHEIIMFGGRVGVSIQQDALGDVWAFDTRTNEWQLRESAAPAYGDDVDVDDVVGLPRVRVA